jgi:tryptophan synthase alpha subunit
MCLGALVVAAATTQVGSSNTDTVERRSPTAIQLDDQPVTSALLDGTELQHAINQALDRATTAEQQPSALLDGTELQHAINQALDRATTAEQQPSALLDGTELQHAINQALDRATTAEQQPSALLDGTELQHASGVRGGSD